jgi:hypothetical protein
MLMVTGWNEWTAAVWETPDVVFLNRKTVQGQGHMVDEFNMEFNRDIEPMRGGYRDTYYWQFVSNMRRYKGMAPPPTPSPPKTIDATRPAEWADVCPTFRDASGDVANRACDATVPGIRYVDDSARNDLVTAQLARDDHSLFFRVQTAAPLTTAADAHWMMLYLDTDADAATGWHGYDFLVNRTREGHSCSVERYTPASGAWEKIAMVPVRHWLARHEFKLSLWHVALGGVVCRGQRRAPNGGLVFEPLRSGVHASGGAAGAGTDRVARAPRSPGSALEPRCSPGAVVPPRRRREVVEDRPLGRR